MSVKLQAALIAGFFALLTAVVILTHPVRAAAETSQPYGHFMFCQEHPEECSIETNDEPIELDEQLMAEIRMVNWEVNAFVTPMEDIDIFGVEEKWSYPVMIVGKAGGRIQWLGDCEDYVLEKRRRLADRIGLGNLLITEVSHPDLTSHHAVLTIRTSRGELILDNRTGFVLAPDMTGYTFLKRQSSRHTGRWVSLKNRKVPNG